MPEFQSLKAKGLKLLKDFHLIAVASWVCGAVAKVTEGGVLYGINRGIHHFDMSTVIIPRAFVCLITGLMYSSFSNWGFFKYTWIIFKS